MTEKIKKSSAVFGLVFTVAAALFMIVMTFAVYSDAQVAARMRGALFDCGVDVICAMIAAGLYYGCMKQESEGTRAFRALNVFVSAGFVVNFLMYYTVGAGQSTATFVFIMLSKLIDLGMIWFFYQYVRRTLGFEGKLAAVAEKAIPVMLVLETLVILSNIFYPMTFLIDGAGNYQPTDISFLEDIYLAVTSIVTAILIIRCKRPLNQKVAALTFICLPLVNYAMVEATFGNASQYGMILVSLIIMYCIIFNDKSSKLAATQSELNMATEIQANALPSVDPEFSNREAFELFASMNPAKEVGGDFYDFFMIDDAHFCLLIADVSGKGVPAALFMMTAKTMIKDYAMTLGSTAEIFTAVNARLCEGNEAGMFATAWIGILDLRTMTVQYTNAGHNYPVLLRKGQPCELVKDRHGLFLAGMEFTKYKQSEMPLASGDRLLLYTDGVVEAHDRAKELYGEDRLQKVLDSTRDRTGQQTLECIFADVNEYAAGVPQFDDITMVVLTIK